ncbi:MAG: hypothetical protein HY788_20855 [Deltaproteobacteria bacterium]|nr:hypothetical protein [Deltaproteobacteria bacterium]
MSFSYLPIFLFIQAIVDLSLIGIVVYWFFFRVPKREKRLEALFESLSRVVSESDRSMREFEGAIKQEQMSLKRILEIQKEREAEMRSLVAEAETLLRRFEQVRALGASGSELKTDAYGQVLELASSGASVSDIAKRTGVPENEVRLLLDLRK